MDCNNEVCYDKNKFESEILIVHDKENFGSSNEENILESLLENINLSWEHYKIIFLLVIYITGEGFVMIGISLIVPVISEAWKLTEFQKGFIGGSVFLGFTLGAISSGLISDTKGRKISFVLGNILSLIGGVLGYVYSFQIEWMLVSNILLGFGIGVSIPAILSLCSEITPTKIRSVIIGSVWIVFVIGEILGCVLAMKYKMYHYENGNWRILLFYRSLSVSN